MIGHLTGKILSSKPTKLVLDVNGVGYVLSISINTFEKVSGKESVSLFVYTSVKEDSITLFGFYSEAEKEMFELLITVNGIGPKLAINLLSGIQTDDLKNAIETSNISRITAIPGIGRKTAERLVLELRTKVEQVKEEGAIPIPVSVKQEAVSALTTLGYNSKISENIIRNILQMNPSLPLEEMIKKALSELGK